MVLSCVYENDFSAFIFLTKNVSLFTRVKMLMPYMYRLLTELLVNHQEGTPNHIGERTLNKVKKGWKGSKMEHLGE